MIKHLRKLSDLSNLSKAIIALALILLMVILGYLPFRNKDERVDTILPVKKSNPVDRKSFGHGIDSIVSSYGIENNWKKDLVIKGKNSRDTSILISKEILIPSDLPAAELNLEISNFLRGCGFGATVTEQPLTRDIEMKIYNSEDSSKKTVGYLNLNYSDTVRRNAAAVSVIMDNLDSYEPADAERVLKSGADISFAIRSDRDKAEVLSMIKENGRDYLLVVTAGKNVDDDFNDEMSEHEKKAGVKSLASEFRGASGIIISSQYGGLADFLKEEFRKNEIAAFDEKYFSKIIPQEPSFKNLHDEIISKTKNGAVKQLYLISIKSDEFAELEQMIASLKKTGYKFYPFGEFQKKVIARDSLKTSNNQKPNDDKK